MCKKLFQLIPATLLCFLFACQGSQAPNGKSQSNIDGENPFEDIREEISSTSEPAPTSSPHWDLSDIELSDVNEEKKLIALTFDDAPSRTLERILAVFAAFNEENPDCKASATVFCNGVLFDVQTPHLLHAALALGFELGNHTQSHADLTKLTARDLQTEIDQTDELLSKIDGKERHLLRAPFGRINADIKEKAPAPLIDWTIDTLDWTGVSEEEIYRSVMDNLFPGAIVLMHDGYEHTLTALKRLLPDLKKAGYQTVSISKMAKAHGCKLKNGSVYIRARQQKTTR